MAVEWAVLLLLLLRIIEALGSIQGPRAGYPESFVVFSVPSAMFREYFKLSETASFGILSTTLFT
jgi:hypothetical protein